MSPPRPRARGWLCMSLLAVGCAEATASHVPWPVDLASVFFFLHSDGTRVREHRGPFVWTDAGPPPIEFEEIEGLEGYLLGFEPEDLRRAVPRLSRALNPADLQLKLEPETCERGRYERSDQGHFRAIRLPEVEHEVWRLDAETDEWIAVDSITLSNNLSLRVPEDPGLCASGLVGDSYGTFAAREAWLEDVEVLGGRPVPTRPPLSSATDDDIFVDGAWVERDLVVAASRNGIFRIERGSEFEDGPRAYRPLGEELDALIGEDGFFLEVLDRDRRAYPDGRPRFLFIALNADIPGRPRFGVLGRVTLEENGFSPPEVLWSQSERLRALVFEATGRGLVVGHGGTVLLLDPDPAAPIRKTEFQNGVPWLTNIELTGDSARPHLVTTEQNSFFLGDITTGEGETIRPADTLSGTPAHTAHYRDEDGLLILSSLYLAGLLRYQEASGWAPSAFSFPNHVGDCASLADECGREHPPGIAYGLHAHRDGWFLASMAQCEAVFVLDVEAECARVLLAPGVSQGRTTEAGFVRRLDVQDGRALIVGTKGRLIEIALP